jgi:hypothetical protein
VVVASHHSAIRVFRMTPRSISTGSFAVSAVRSMQSDRADQVVSCRPLNHILSSAAGWAILLLGRGFLSGYELHWTQTLDGVIGACILIAIARAFSGGLQQRT